MNDIAFLEKKASKVSAVLTDYAGDEGHLARPGHHCTMPYGRLFSGGLGTYAGELLRMPPEVLFCKLIGPQCVLGS